MCATTRLYAAAAAAILLAALAVDPLIGSSWQIELATGSHTTIRHPIDGSTFVGGSIYGLPGACASSSQAFVQKLAADGTEEWMLGKGFADGDLIAQLQAIDPSYVVSSSIYDLAFDAATSRLAVTGTLILAWRTEGDAVLTVSQGAFVALVATDGTVSSGAVLSDAWLGASPAGPPAGPIDCRAMCRQAAGADLEQYGGRGVAFGAGGVALTGWSAASGVDGPTPFRRYFVALYEGDLSALRWIDFGASNAYESGLDLVADASGQIFMTGFGGIDRDVLLARYQADGSRDRIAYTEGAYDDEGHTIEFDGDGNLVVAGRLTGLCSFSGVTVGQGGADLQEFVGVFDQDLQAISTEVTDPFAPAKSRRLALGDASSDRAATEGGSEQHVEDPISVQVAVGDLGVGGLDEVGKSDDYHLRVYDSGQDLVELQFLFPVEEHREPLLLTEIRLEIETPFCYQLALHVRNFDTGALQQLGVPQDVCPGDESLRTFHVSPRDSRRLGIDGIQGPIINSDLRLAVRVIFPAKKAACSSCKASTPAKDVSVDHATVTLEYEEE